MSNNSLIISDLANASPLLSDHGQPEIVPALIFIRPDVEACANRTRVAIKISVDFPIDAVIDCG